MNLDFDMENDNQELRLGTELLEMAFKVTSKSETIQAYNDILEMPGVDSALFMLCRAAHEDGSHPRNLLHSAFMLGYYVHESLREMNSLWAKESVDDPI